MVKVGSLLRSSRMWKYTDVCLWVCANKMRGNKSLRHIVKHSVLDFCVCVLLPFSCSTLSPLRDLLHAAFGKWSRRVRFKNSDPTVDSALVIMSTEVSDEGTYLCHVSTFPSGNFEMGISITVWSEWKILPVESLSCDL